MSGTQGVEDLKSELLEDLRRHSPKVDKVYEAKGERFFDTLDSRRVLTTARIEYANALGELWAAEIEALIPPLR